MFGQPQNVFVNIVLNPMKIHGHTIVKRSSFIMPCFLDPNYLIAPIGCALVSFNFF
jgi:hypothetical protein